MKAAFMLKVAVILFLSFLASAHAQSLLVTVGGNQYDLTVVNGSFPANVSAIEAAPWWNSPTTAYNFGNAIIAADTSGAFVPTQGDVILAYAEGSGTVAYDTVVNEGAGGEHNTGYNDSSSVYGSGPYVVLEPVPEPSVISLSFLSAVAVAGRALWLRLRQWRT